MNPLIVRSKLQLASGTADGETFQFRTVDEPYALPDRGAATPATRLEGSEKGDQSTKFRVGDLFERGHAFSGNTLTNDQREAGVILGGKAGQYGGSVLASVSIGTMAPCAQSLKGSPAIRRLSPRHRQ